MGEDGSAYFRISSFPEYGRLSRLKERELARGAGGRTTTDDEYSKETVGDFALWKARRPDDGDNFWPSPWGEGRPGWHLECSAMCREYLGDSFDLPLAVRTSSSRTTRTKSLRRVRWARPSLAIGFMSPTSSWMAER